jgi:SAM-dependent methyltransferase
MTNAIDGIASALGLGGASFGKRALARELNRRAGEAKELAVAALNGPLANAMTDAGHRGEAIDFVDGRIERPSGGFDALVASGLPPVEVAPALLGEWARVVRPGGLVLAATGGLGGRGPARATVAALFLHAGLVDVEQRTARGIVVTSARVR